MTVSELRFLRKTAIIGGLTTAGLYLRWLRRQRTKSIKIMMLKQQVAYFFKNFLDAFTEGSGCLPDTDRHEAMSALIDPQSYIISACRSVGSEIHWVSDWKKWRTSDYWQSPSTTINTATGDCEDASVLLMALLWSAGFRDIRLVVGLWNGEPHAWLEMKSRGLLLESTSGEVFDHRPSSYEPAVELSPGGWQLSS